MNEYDEFCNWKTLLWETNEGALKHLLWSIWSRCLYGERKLQEITGNYKKDISR